MIRNQDDTLAINERHVIRVDLRAPHPDPDSDRMRMVHWTDDELDRQRSWSIEVTTVETASVVGNQHHEVFRSRDEGAARGWFAAIVRQIDEVQT